MALWNAVGNAIGFVLVLVLIVTVYHCGTVVSSSPLYIPIDSGIAEAFRAGEGSIFHASALLAAIEMRQHWAASTRGLRNLTSDSDAAIHAYLVLKI